MITEAEILQRPWRRAAREQLEGMGFLDPSEDLLDYVAQELWREGVIDVRD